MGAARMLWTCLILIRLSCVSLLWTVCLICNFNFVVCTTSLLSLLLCMAFYSRFFLCKVVVGGDIGTSMWNFYCVPTLVLTCLKVKWRATTAFHLSWNLEYMEINFLENWIYLLWNLSTVLTRQRQLHHQKQVSVSMAVNV